VIGVEVGTQWGGMTNLFGGEGGFGKRASGDGEALVSIYSAVDVMDLQLQEVVTVDTGHVVAYDLSISSGCAARSKAAPSSRRKRRGLGIRLRRTRTGVVAVPQSEAFVEWMVHTVAARLPSR